MERPLLPLIFIWFFITGCGPGFQASSANHKSITTPPATADSQDPLLALPGETDDYTTGVFKVEPGADGQPAIKVPYIAAGDSSLLNDLRAGLGAKANAAFGGTIQKVSVDIANNKADVKITFSGSSTPVEFQAPLSPHNQQMVALNMTPTVSGISPQSARQLKNVLSLNLVCTDATCTEIVMVLTKDENTKAGIIYQASTPSAQFQPLDANSFNDYKVQTFKTLGNEASKITAKQVSVTVVPGISYSDIELQDPAKKNVLTVNTDLVDTINGAAQVSNVKSAYDQDLTGQLYGINPTSGNMMLTLTKKDSNEKVSLEIAEPQHAQPDVVPDIVPNAPPPPADDTTPAQPATPAQTSAPAQSAEAPPPTEPSAPGSGLFQLPDRTQNPGGYQMSMGFARYSNADYVRYFVRAWLGEASMKYCPRENVDSPGSYRQTLINFLTYAPAVVPYLEKITDFVGVSHDIGYQLGLESQFLTNKKDPYDPMQFTRGSTAAGPWQILYTTAPEISKIATKQFGNQFSGFRFVLHPKESSYDDRTYFENSTLMASLYIQWLSNIFPGEDPALAILAYNAGPGTMEQAKQKIEDMTQGRHITFDQMVEYHAAIGLNCAAVAYTMRFLALRTIGQHPDVYGITLAPPQSGININRLKNPQTQLPSQIAL